MQSFFEKFIPTSSPFRPSTTTELFALRLAQKLDDASAVGHYVTLAENHSESQLLCAYRRTLRANGNGDRGRVFHRELEHTRANGSHERNGKLISIRVERRAVAAAIFHGDHLEYADSRQLSSGALRSPSLRRCCASIRSRSRSSVPSGGGKVATTARSSASRWRADLGPGTQKPSPAPPDFEKRT
jgi:hypothetical protein